MLLKIRAWNSSRLVEYRIPHHNKPHYHDLCACQRPYNLISIVDARASQYIRCGGWHHFAKYGQVHDDFETVCRQHPYGIITFFVPSLVNRTHGIILCLNIQTLYVDERIDKMQTTG